MLIPVTDLPAVAAPTAPQQSAGMRAIRLAAGICASIAEYDVILCCMCTSCSFSLRRSVGCCRCCLGPHVRSYEPSKRIYVSGTGECVKKSCTRRIRASSMYRSPDLSHQVTSSDGASNTVVRKGGVSVRLGSAGRGESYVPHDAPPLLVRDSEWGLRLPTDV